MSSLDIEIDSDGGFDDERPRTAAIRLLGTRIVAGAPGHEAGDVLPIKPLMEEIQASRSLVREVLQALEHKGMVALKTRVGATVQPLRRWNVLDPDVITWRLEAAPRFPFRSMTELREAVEPRAAFLAAQRASGEVCRDLVNLAVKLKTLAEDKSFDDIGEAGDAKRDEFQAVDAKLHRKILEGSNNEMFLSLAVPVEEALRFRIKSTWEGARREEKWAKRLGSDTHRVTSPAGTAKVFPRRPERLAMWFHYGLVYAIEQQRPQAAETFSRAIIAELQVGRLNDPYLQNALQLAIRELDLSGFPEADREPFFEDVITVAAT